jgi:hypothetical protein
MHFLHVIAVEAPDEASAIAETEAFIDRYEGEAWDWFEVGGRWDDELAGKSAMCAKDGPSAFMAAAEQATNATTQEIRAMIQDLTGVLSDPLTPEQVLAQGMDPVKYFEFRVRSQTVATQAAKEFTDLCDDPAPLSARYGMLGYRLRRLGSLVADYFVNGMVFYDAVYGTRDLANLRERVTATPETQWLVVVDCHN